MNYKLIENYGIKEETVFEIGVFSILWNILEEKYFEKNLTNDKIETVARNVYSVDLIPYCKALIDALLEYLNENKETITIDKIRTKLYSSGFRGHYSKMEQAILGENDNEELFCGSLLLLYRLRNNLFHGEKTPISLNDQITLFKKANLLINKLLEN